ASASFAPAFAPRSAVNARLPKPALLTRSISRRVSRSSGQEFQWYGITNLPLRALIRCIQTHSTPESHGKDSARNEPDSPPRPFCSSPMMLHRPGYRPKLWLLLVGWVAAHMP